MQYAVARDEATTDSPSERIQRLNDITDAYFRGEMSVEEFVKSQRELGPDWEAAFENIAKRRQASLVGPAGTRRRVRVRDLVLEWIGDRRLRRSGT